MSDKPTSNKPVPAQKKASKKALLDELESIKHLLDDEDSSELEPPLLTQEFSAFSPNSIKDDRKKDSEDDFDPIEDDFPVLTDSVDHSEIPTLGDSIPNHPKPVSSYESNYANQDAEVDEDDIVSRALRSKTKPPSLFDDDELSPEMLAINSTPKEPAKNAKPIEEKATISEVTVKKTLEDDLESLAKKVLEEDEEDDEEFDDSNFTLDLNDDLNDILLDDDVSGLPNEAFEALPEKRIATNLEGSIVAASDLDSSELEQESESVATQPDHQSIAPHNSDIDTDINEAEEYFSEDELTLINSGEEAIDDENGIDSLLDAAILDVTDSIVDEEVSENSQKSKAPVATAATTTATTIDEKEVKLTTKEISEPKEHQPSLFDAESTPADTLTPTPKASTEKTSIEKSWVEKPVIAQPEKKINATSAPTTPSTTTQTTKSIPVAGKTENPFLPQHIRDRLHTNRTLQQEIDASSAETARNTGEHGSIVASSTASVTPAMINQHLQHATEKMSADQQKTKSQEDSVVEEVLGAVLPKIESELRQKIRELIKQEQSSNKT